MRIVAVDIGIIHMAVVEIDIGDADASWNGVASMRLFDVTRLPHERVCREKCTLHHTNELCDRMAHFFQETKPVWEDADTILIERQPITGLQAVQLAYLASPWRDKIQLLSPCTMHRFYDIHKLCYEGRKHATCAIMDEVLRIHGQTQTFAPCLARMSRKHDVADAVCFAWWWAELRRRDLERRAEDEAFEVRAREAAEEARNPFEEFMLVPRATAKYFPTSSSSSFARKIRCDPGSR